MIYGQSNVVLEVYTCCLLVYSHVIYPPTSYTPCGRPPAFNSRVSRKFYINVLNVMAGPETHTSRAINACLTCRKQKRKCTKERPRCFVCRKTGRACDYTPIGRRSATATDTIGSPDPEETGENVSLASRSVHPSGYEKSAMGAGSSTTNGLFTLFLDSEVSPDRSYLESNTRITLPPEYLPYLRSPAKVRHEVDVYLNSVHTFFPIGKIMAKVGSGGLCDRD